MKIIDRVVDLIFPRRCAVCDNILSLSKRYICDDCKGKIVYVEEPTCLKCGKTIEKEAEYCLDCTRRKHKYIQGKSVFDYGSISDSLYRFKNKGRVEYGKFYALEIMKKNGNWLRSISPDVIVPVPVHSSRLFDRGYNQAEVVAKELSKLSGIPVDNSLIIREKRTAPLKDLTLSQRQDYLKKGFKVTQKGVKLETIVILDDIYTTGSTIDEIADTILRSFNCKIYFLTITIGRGV